MSLREAIKENHDKAEEHPFTKAMFGGKLSKEAYSDYLANMLYCYETLENVGDRVDLFDGLDGIKRSELIGLDLAEYEGHTFNLRSSAVQYVKHIESLTTKHDLMAHVYVRYMGDMYGGQMLKRVVPSAGHMYEFEDRPGLIAKVRAQLTDSMADEANKSFELTLKLFDELAHDYNL